MDVDIISGWPRCIHGRHDTQRGVENLQINFILNLSAPAGPRYRYYGDADEIPRDISVEGDCITQMGLHHGTLQIRGEHRSYTSITSLIHITGRIWCSFILDLYYFVQTSSFYSVILVGTTLCFQYS